MDNLGTLVVRGANVLAPPLLETKAAKSLEFRDKNGDLLCFWRRIFDNNADQELWVYCSRSDKDWEEVCVHYGYTNPKPGTTMKQVLGG